MSGAKIAPSLPAKSEEEKTPAIDAPAAPADPGPRAETGLSRGVAW
jgi:hypothetical protein